MKLGKPGEETRFGGNRTKKESIAQNLISKTVNLPLGDLSYRIVYVARLISHSKQPIDCDTL